MLLTRCPWSTAGAPASIASSMTFFATAVSLAHWSAALFGGAP
jgi:hypothetical protein